jgi:ArsR family transcriptional regulator, arsenate/arsenite/antimonite-responsive transcriptional repressor
MDVDGCILAYPSTIMDGFAYDPLMALKELPVARQRGVCCGLPAVDASWAEGTAELMKALADPTRLKMIASLWKAKLPICICDFTAGLELSQPTISHHMAKLKEVGLVDSEKQGIWIYYRLRTALPSATRQLLTHLIA